MNSGPFFMGGTLFEKRPVGRVAPRGVTGLEAIIGAGLHQTDKN